ncbi:MAG: hypothetical protein A2162_01475 [Deltaproteobacteria bacterium RBG_13_52_11b]|nr:MAG: hypothetical protein A2162_01475 [Deltaproteobacteria bacterium RBG_13_52_11b]
MAKTRTKDSLLRGSRVYLSGPMDFVASRALEKASGWRTRVGQFLRGFGGTGFDPWNKPAVRGMHEYGREGEQTTDARQAWTYKRGRKGAQTRAEIAASFWPALHIDLRMVDTSDFVIAYCPTNVYSVGTPHEILLARQERKPVLFISPYVHIPALEKLRGHLAEDAEGLALLKCLEAQDPIKENLNASPSLWYMPLVGAQHFFDGFGFEPYRSHFRWSKTPLDDTEASYAPQNPLLPFLERLNRTLPKKWHSAKKMFVPDDDWILWDLRPESGGNNVSGPKRRKI